MPDYQQGKIYTIRCRDDLTKIYVGSTIQSLSKRWGGHKINSIKQPNRLLYQTINSNFDGWYIELYELYPCNSKMELEKREGEITREIANLNMCIAGRTWREWYEDNIDKIKEQQKQYNQDNADKIKEQRKQYKQDNADKFKEYKKKYRQDNADKLKKQDKQYNQDNADKIKEYKKQYRQENADKIKELNRKYRQDKKKQSTSSQ